MADDARLVMSVVIDKCKGNTVFEGLESVNTGENFLFIFYSFFFS